MVAMPVGAGHRGVTHGTMPMIRERGKNVRGGIGGSKWEQEERTSLECEEGHIRCDSTKKMD